MSREDDSKAPMLRLGNMVKGTHSPLHDVRLPGPRVAGLKTGFRRFDKLTSGLQEGDLIIVAARPSMGKTAWALNVAEYATLRLAKPQPVGIFSLEMTKEALFVRILCSEARVDSHKFRSGFLSKKELNRIAIAVRRLANAPIFIDDNPWMSIDEIRSKALSLQSQRDLVLVVIDCMQLMVAPEREQPNVEISEIGRGLKTLAKELRVPVIALCQLGFPPEEQANWQRPQLSDLSPSSLEQDADLVCFLHREEYYLRIAGREVPADLVGRAELIVAKQRNGCTGTLPLTFTAACANFRG